ncbi:MAG: hypothetical protein U0401_35350 [Anaerolineae bacterium]
MRQNILVAIIVVLLIAIIVASLNWNHRNQTLSQTYQLGTALAQNIAHLDSMRVAQATDIAEIKATATTQMETDLAYETRVAGVQATATAVNQAYMAAQTEIESQRQFAQAQTLAAQSQQVLNDTPEDLMLSVLLATESLQRLPTVEGNIALRRSLSLLPRPLVQLNHEDNVETVAFVPDTTWLVTGGKNHKALIWDLSNTQKLMEFAHESTVYTVEPSPNGKWFATITENGIARIWDIVTQKETVKVELEDKIRTVAFSPDSEKFATGGDDNIARIWDVNTGREILSLSHASPLASVNFSSDGKWLVTGSSNDIRIWDTNNGHELNRFDGGGRSVAFTPDNKLLAILRMGLVQIRTVETGEIITVIKEVDPIEDMTVNPNNQWLATGTVEGRVRVWDILTGKEIVRLAHHSYGISLAFSSDGMKLATGNWDEVARVWQIEQIPETEPLYHSERVNQITFSPDSQWLATKSEDNTARLWDVSAGKEIAYIEHKGSINSLTFSADGKQLATASSDGTVNILDTTTRQLLTFSGHEGPVNQVVFSPDNQLLATASDDNTAKIWDVKTGYELATLRHNSFFTNTEGITKPWSINSVSFSPDGQWLATASDDSTARIWEVNTGRELVLFNQKEKMAPTVTDWRIRDADFINDEDWLITRSDAGATTDTAYQTRIYEISTQTEITRTFFAAFTNDGQVAAFYDYNNVSINQLSPTLKTLWIQGMGGRRTFVFSSNGDLLATGSWNPRYNFGDASVWDVKTGQELAYLPHDGQVWLVAFSPDNQWVATLSSGAIGPNYEGGGMRLWDIKTGREIIYLKNSGNTTFSPDSHWLAASDSSGNVHLLYLQPEDLVADACSRLSRNLSHLEWRQYIGNEPYRGTCPNLPIPKQ